MARGIHQLESDGEFCLPVGESRLPVGESCLPVGESLLPVPVGDSRLPTLRLLDEVPRQVVHAFEISFFVSGYFAYIILPRRRQRGRWVTIFPYYEDFVCCIRTSMWCQLSVYVIRLAGLIDIIDVDNPTCWKGWRPASMVVL
jgi:hypothetical protein